MVSYFGFEGDCDDSMSLAVSNVKDWANSGDDTTQAIGQTMANLVFHLWLNLTEIKDTGKTAFLDSLVSP